MNVFRCRVREIGGEKSKEKSEMCLIVSFFFLSCDVPDDIPKQDDDWEGRKKEKRVRNGKVSLLQNYSNQIIQPQIRGSSKECVKCKSSK